MKLYDDNIMINNGNNACADLYQIKGWFNSIACDRRFMEQNVNLQIL